MNRPAIPIAAAAGFLLLLSSGLATAQSPLPPPPTLASKPSSPQPPEAFLPARLLLSHRVAASPDAGGLLVETLAQIAELTQKGKSIGNAMRVVFGPLAGNEWLRTCVLANWRVMNDFGLLSPDNLQRMHAGEMPAAGVGTYAGKAMAVISAPDSTSSGVTYRLVPAPLQKGMAQQAQTQAAADRLAAFYAENRRIAEQREIEQHATRTTATPPPVPPRQPQPQDG